MRRTFRGMLSVVSLLAISASTARGQENDLDRGLHRLVDEYISLYRPDRLAEWRALFVPTFSVTSTTADGGVSVRGLDAFYQAQERGFARSKEMGERLENVQIERRGRLASVWADFVFWQDGNTSRGKLVLLAAADRGSWRFHSLMFTYEE